LRDYRQLYSRMSDLEEFDKRMLLLEVFNKFQTCEEIGCEFRSEEFFTMIHEKMNEKKLVKAATDTRQTNII